MKNIFIKMLGANMDVLQKNETYKFYFNSINREKIEDQFYITNKKKGIGLVFNNTHSLCSIHFHNEEKDGYNCFNEELPFNIEFKDNFDTLQNKLNMKDYESGGGEVLPFLGKSNIWRKFFFDEFYLHFEIGITDSIVLITLGVLHPNAKLFP